MNIRDAVSRTVTHRRIIHARLKRRLILFPLIAVVMFAVVIVDAIVNGVNPLWILVGTLTGLGIGLLVGQIYKIYWHEEKEKVVSGIDRMSVLLIVAYVLVRIGSEQLIGRYVHGSEFTVVTYSFIAGILAGRMIGVFRKVDRVLQAQTIRPRTSSNKRRR